MFKSIKNSHFAACDDNDSYAKMLYIGESGGKIKKITSQIRDLTPEIPDLNSVKSFFNKYINKEKVELLFEEFCIPSNYEVNFDALVYSLAKTFIEYNQHDEDDILDDCVAYYYINYLKNPSSTNQIITDDNLIYVMEMNGKCPLCPKHTKLLIEHNGIKTANYRITKILPKNIEKNIENELISYRNLSDLIDTTYNHIALCPSCNNIYTLQPNLEDYKTLIKAKDNALLDEKIQEILENDSLEEDLIKILNYLLKEEYDDDSLPELSMDAKVITDKIPNIDPITYNSIIRTNLKTYPIIDKYLSNQFGKDINDSTALGRRIKLLSESLDAKGLKGTNLLDEVIISLNSSLPMENRNINLVRIIVFYFLQHCEVL